MDSLLHDIRRAYAGNAVLSPDITSTLVEHIHQQADSLEKDTVRSLTGREIEVLVCLADGMSNRAIAEKLSICEATVKFHLHAIFEKLHVSNRTKAVMIAIEQDLVQLRRDLRGRADRTAASI
jgi:DNA-binding NarL/FixJ family response regulator